VLRRALGALPIHRAARFAGRILGPPLDLLGCPPRRDRGFAAGVPGIALDTGLGRFGGPVRAPRAVTHAGLCARQTSSLASGGRTGETGLQPARTLYGVWVPRIDQEADVSTRAPARTSLETPRAKNQALALLAMTQFVIVIDASIVNVALPSIGHGLSFSRADLSWVVNAYTLTFGGFLLLGGRLADLLGRRRMFMYGLVLFALASLVGGLAQSEAWLLAARAVQGLGAALVSPAALSLVTTTFSEGSERNRALGVWGAVAGAGGAAGVLLGGILTSGLNWRWVLFVNVPIAVIAAALAPRVLVESRVEDERHSFDIPGALTVTAGLSLLVYALVDAVNVGWGSAATLLKLAGAALLLIAFVMIELRERWPLMPFSIFRLRTLRGANVVGLLVGMSLFSMFFFISLYLQNVLHFSPIKTGLSYLPLASAIIVSAGIASQLVTRVGFKPTLIAGLLFVAAGLAWFSQVRPGGSFAADVLGPSLLAAIGLGLSFVTVTIAAVTGTRPHEAGLASGLINTAQQVGGALGLAILATIANSRTKSVLAGGSHDVTAALTKGFDRAFLVGAGFALAGAILAAVLISTRDSREHATEARAQLAAAEASG
jgi:EmrB/QacA subfamily drug resistance transporter